MIQEINILIPDGESTWVVNVIRCLRAYKNYNLHLISKTSQTAARYSRYIKSFYVINGNDQLEEINNAIRFQQIHLVMPIAEEMSKFLITNKNSLDRRAKLMLLPDLKSYSIATNKKHLYNHLISNNLPTPKSQVINALPRELVTEISFPVLVKPLDLKGGEGILKFNCEKDLENYMLFRTESDELLIQEYIDGFDIDCSVLCENGQILTYTIQEEYLSSNNPYAPQLGVSFVNNKDVLSVVSKVLKSLSWSGIAHIDLRFDRTQKNYKIIEINGRFWGSTEASKAAGVNFPLEIINKSLGFSLSKSNYKNLIYIKHKGLFKKPFKLFNFNFMRNNTDLCEVCQDPLPTLFRLKEWILRKLP
ncbi:ATP-grasp domain-containing protein [Flavobacteriaceae bacterium]|jgi:predicted ATP-grasp superfamily ATP-dependent carboligase|nr:ATP-grasp domain-containing protein [Flavobacteriaceae bacterium]